MLSSGEALERAAKTRQSSQDARESASPWKMSSERYAIWRTACSQVVFCAAAADASGKVQADGLPM